MRAKQVTLSLAAACVALALSVYSWAQSSKRSGCLCGAQEKKFFSCRTAGGKSIALCGRSDGLIQYRFGTRQKVELQFPPDASQTLRYAGYMRSQTENYEISFSVSNATYTVFDYMEEGERAAGVRVTKSDGTEAVMKCDGKFVSRLAELESHLPCDKDNALNLGGCEQRAP